VRQITNLKYHRRTATKQTNKQMTEARIFTTKTDTTINKSIFDNKYNKTYKLGYNGCNKLHHHCMMLPNCMCCNKLRRHSTYTTIRKNATK